MNLWRWCWLRIWKAMRERGMRANIVPFLLIRPHTIVVHCLVLSSLLAWAHDVFMFAFKLQFVLFVRFFILSLASSLGRTHTCACGHSDLFAIYMQAVSSVISNINNYIHISHTNAKVKSTRFAPALEIAHHTLFEARITSHHIQTNPRNKQF